MMIILNNAPVQPARIAGIRLNLIVLLLIEKGRLLYQSEWLGWGLMLIGYLPRDTTCRK